jgi:ketosteroid isomerase-like protein
MMKTPFQWVARIQTLATVAALAMLVLIGNPATARADDPAQTGLERRNAEVVREAFARGVGAPDSFYSILADDVQWTVARAAEPTTYTSRSQFLQEGAGPIRSRLDGDIHANVRQLVVENDVVVAIWDGTATSRDSRPYVNRYVWVMTMRDEQVMRVTAFLDLVALNELLDRVQPA